MARNSNVTQEVADQLAAAVREVRRLMFGGDGIPVWGTKFVDIESKGMAVGMEFARQFMEQAVDDQAEHVPTEAFDTGGGEQAAPVPRTPLKLETGAGAVEWQQPASYLNESRRSFFPSGEGLGH
jgi:hypothetical protein